MLWVVIGHSYLGEFCNGPQWENVLTRIAYSFHMPLFMAISGFLFYKTRLSPAVPGGNRKWTFLSMLSDKCLRLLLPYCVFTVIGFLAKMACPSDVSRTVSFSLKSLLSAFIYPYDNPLRELWFIATLFWMFLLMPLWRLCLRNSVVKWSVLALLLGLHFYHFEIELFCLNYFFAFAVFFYLGLLASESKWFEAFVDARRWYVAAGGLLVFILGWFVNSFIATIGGIVCSVALAMVFDHTVPKMFSSFRDYTYQIFLMGLFPQFLVKILFRHFELPYVPAYIVCILSGVYIPVLLSMLLKYINWPPLLYCVGMKPKTNRGRVSI